MATIGEGIASAGRSIGAGFAQAGKARRLQERETARSQAVIDAAALQRTQKLEDRSRLQGNVEQVIRQKLGMPTTEPETPVIDETLDVTDDPTKVSEVSENGAPQVIAGVGFTPGMAKPFAKILAQNPQSFSTLINFLKTADDQKITATAKTSEQNLQMGVLLSRAKNKEQMNFMIKNIIETKPNLTEPQREQLLRVQNDPDFENSKLRINRVITENTATKELLTEHNKVRAESRALETSEIGRGRDSALGVLTTAQSQTDPNVQVQMLEQGVADLKAQGLNDGARVLQRIVDHPQRTLRLSNLISGTIGAIQPAAVTTAQLKPVTGKASVISPKNLTDDGFLIERLPNGNIQRTKVEGVRQISDSKKATGQTNIFSNGTIVNALKDGKSQVIAPDGTTVTGDDRVKVLQDANKNELDIARATAGQKAAGSASIAASVKAFDRISGIKKSILNIDNAIQAIDDGAKTGPIISKLPTIRASSIRLNQIQGQLGLDVIGTTTFGALSESELNFALSTALPRNLKPPALRQWLVEKKAAQEKLADYLQDVSIFLGTPGNTVAGWLEAQQAIQSQLGTEGEGESTTPATGANEFSTMSDDDLLGTF